MEHVQNQMGPWCKRIYYLSFYMPIIYISPLYTPLYIHTHYVLHAVRSAKARRIVDVQNLINYFIKIVFYWHSNLDFGNLRLYLALSLCIHASLYVYTVCYIFAIKLSVYMQLCLSLYLSLRPTRRMNNFNWFLTNLLAVGHRPLSPSPSPMCVCVCAWVCRLLIKFTYCKWFILTFSNQFYLARTNWKCN